MPKSQPVLVLVYVWHLPRGFEGLNITLHLIPVITTSGTGGSVGRLNIDLFYDAAGAFAALYTYTELMEMNCAHYSEQPTA